MPERKIHYHGYTIERTSGPNGGMYTIWDSPQRRVDKGGGFNSIVEAQIYLNRLESNPPYFENDYRTGFAVAQQMLELYLEKYPENAAYFSYRAAGRFAEAIAEEIARLRARKTGEDNDDYDEDDEDNDDDNNPEW